MSIDILSLLYSFLVVEIKIEIQREKIINTDFYMLSYNIFLP